MTRDDACSQKQQTINLSFLAICLLFSRLGIRTGLQIKRKCFWTRVVRRNTKREIPGNTVREIRDRPVNTGKYGKNCLKVILFL